MFGLVNTSFPLGKHILGVIGASIAFLHPTIPFILICTLAVLCDCYTAWSLSRRVKKKYPGSNDGKFKSHYAGRVFATLCKVYALTVLVFLIDTFVFPDINMHLANIVAGAVCFWQVWSMLENESSCNDAKWAKIAQRILVDKTERHFDIDLHELKENNVEQAEQVAELCGSTSCAYKNTKVCFPKDCPRWSQPEKKDESK